MAGPALSSDLERELRALRARAYGPDADIQDDPVALARLDELESARITVHAAPTPPVESSEAVAKTESAQGAVLFTDDDVSARSRVGATRPGTRVMASRAGRIWLIVGSVVVVLAVVTATTWFAAPKPKATLQATGVAADSEIFSLAFTAPLAEVDNSTLRGFEPYHGVEPWVAMNAQGSRCLMAMERTTDRLAGIRCAPPDAELRLDLPVLPLDPGFNYAAGLAPGTVIRFEVRGDAVDVYLFTPPGTD